MNRMPHARAAALALAALLTTAAAAQPEAEPPRRYLIDLAPLFERADAADQRDALLSAAVDQAERNARAAHLRLDALAVSIEDFGAAPDDPSAAAANTAAINAAFEAAGRQRFAAVYVPGRAYWIDDTIQIPKRTGYALLGCGGGTQVYESEHRDNRIGGPQSRLVWAGPNDRPMVRYRGAGLYWRGVQLHGRPKGSDAPKAAIGLLIENGQSGLGTGKITAPYIGVMQCETGLQFGSTWPADNGDVSQFGRLHVADCGVGLKTVGRLAYEIVVQFVRNQRCGVVFDYHGGGGLHVYGGQTLAQGGTLLRLNEGVDPNNSMFRIQGWHVDHQRPGTRFKLLEMTARAWAHVTIQADLPAAQDYPTPIAEVIGPTCLRLVDGMHLAAGAVACREHKSGRPTVLFESCRLKSGARPADLIDRAASSGRWEAAARDCYGHYGGLQDDWRGAGE